MENEKERESYPLERSNDENQSVCMKEGNFGLMVMSLCERQHNAVMMCSSGDPSQPLHECHVACFCSK